MVVVKDIYSSDYVKVDVNDTVSKMLGKLKKAKKYYGLVFDKNKYLGLVGKRFLLTTRSDPSVMKVKNIIKKRSKSKTPFYVPILKPETSIHEAGRLIAAADVKALPVMKNNKIIGVVNSIALAKAIKDDYKDVACEQLASMNIIKANYKDGIDKIINLMNRRHIDHIPVVDNKNKILGLVAMGDIMEEYQIWTKFNAQKIPRNATHQNWKQTCYDHGQKNRILNLSVENILNKNVCTAKPDISVKVAMQKMIKANKSSVILVENNEPVGILTLRDVFIDYAKYK